MIYITGAVFSRTEGFTNLADLAGAFGFHLVCMFLGGFCFVTGTQKAAEKKSAPAAQAQ